MDKIDLDKIPTSWGWRLKRLGKSQKGFATKVGVGSATLSHAVTGKTDTLFSIVIKVEHAIRELEAEYEANKSK